MGWLRSRKAGVCVCALLALGIYGVADALNLLFAGPVLLVALGLLALREARWSSPAADALRGVGAALVSFLTLAGFDVLVNFLLGPLIHASSHGEARILLGLVVATVLFAAVGYWYLCRFVGRPPRDPVAIKGMEIPVRMATAATLAFLLVLALPYAYGKITADTHAVPPSKPVASQLDVRIVADGRPQPPPQTLPPTPVLEEFDVSYPVGFASGDGVRWTLVDDASQDEALTAIAAGDRRPEAGAQPTWRRDADHLVLLLVDGTAPVVEEPATLEDKAAQPGEVARWGGVGSAAIGAGKASAFALLLTARGGGPRLRPAGGFYGSDWDVEDL